MSVILSRNNSQPSTAGLSARGCAFLTPAAEMGLVCRFRVAKAMFLAQGGVRNLDAGYSAIRLSAD